MFDAFSRVRKSCRKHAAALIGVLRVLIVLAATSSSSAAGVNVWTKVDAGGRLAVVAASPSQPGLVWAVEGYDRLIKSTDGGQTWDSAVPGEGSYWGSKSTEVGETWNGAMPDADTYWSSVYELVVDPVDRKTLFMAWNDGKEAGLCRTRNGGRTWVDLDILASTLSVNTINHDVMYAIDYYYPEVWKSADGGDNWRRIFEFDADHEPRSIKVDPASPSNVYVGTTGGVFKSTDAGVKWVSVNNGLPAGGQGLLVSALSAHSRRSDTVWAATNRGLYRTTNGGTEWVRLSRGLPAVEMYDVVVSPSDPDVLYVVTVTGEVYRGTRGGATWLAVPIPGAPSTGRIHLQVDAASADTVLAISDGSGILRSTDGGRSWELTGKGLSFGVNEVVASPKHGGTVYAVGGLILKSRDGGSTWGLASGGLREYPDYYGLGGLLVHPKNTLTLYSRSATELIYRSTDGGKSWTATTQPWHEVTFEAFTIDPANPRRLLVMVDGALLESLDRGDHWHLLSSDLPGAGDVRPLVFDPRRPGVFYAGVSTDAGHEEKARLWRSEDDGKCWSPFSPVLAPSWGFKQIAPDPHNPGVFFVIAGGTLLRWKQGDGHWSMVFPETDSYRWFTQVAFDPDAPGTMYVASDESGVWRSLDGGTNWHPINRGLPTSGSYTWVNSITVDAEQPVLYAGTEDGIYVRTIRD
ncbi:MAG: hypothetical protein AB1714_16810 [Acidobacteriota bacterium]